MAQSALLGLAGLAIGAAVVTGLTLLIAPVESVPGPLAGRAAPSEETAVPLPASKPPHVRTAALAAPGPNDSADARATQPPSPPPPAPPKQVLDTVAPDPSPKRERIEPAQPQSHALEKAPALAAADTTAAVQPPPAAPVSVQQPPAWRRFAAVAPAVDDSRPQIVVVLDDLGLSEFRSDRAVALPRPLTMAILPYGQEPGALVARARAAGHEVIVHLPMEPQSGEKDPGPNALLTELSIVELDRRIAHNLDRMQGYVGVNNHMGSRFTASSRDMERVMLALKARGLLFLDSLTTGASQGRRLALRHGVPSASRDIFLDNDRSPRAIAAQLSKVEAVARRQGHAIAIGHPYPETLDALSRWLPMLRERGFELAPISAVVARRLTG